jgi:hypothetical protein
VAFFLPVVPAASFENPGGLHPGRACWHAVPHEASAMPGHSPSNDRS